MVSYRARVIRLLSAFVIVASGIVAVLFGAAQPALALGPGKVCVFNAPSGFEVGPVEFGHTGWGYLIAGSSQWFYGATENEMGQPVILPGHDIGYWDRHGTFQQMLNAFYNPSGPTLGRIGVGYYQTYKCYATGHSSVGAENIARLNVRCGGYLGLFDNSLDQTIYIIKTYDSSIPVPSAADYPAPNDWYANLGPVSGWPGPSGLRNDSSGTGADPGGSC